MTTIKSSLVMVHTPRITKILKHICRELKDLKQKKFRMLRKQNPNSMITGILGIVTIPSPNYPTKEHT